MFRIKTEIMWPVAYRLRRLAGRGQAPQEAPYSFERARQYWSHVPRADGARFFDTVSALDVPPEKIATEFDTEINKARGKKERRVGFRLASEAIARLDSPRVMDYGSGLGFYGFEMLSRYPAAHVTFVDINETNLKAVSKIAAAKKMAERVICRLVTDEAARDLDLKLDYDLILSMGVLHHTPHAARIVQTLTRFLKPGAVFQVLLYNKNYLKKMQGVTGRTLDESGFGALTDPGRPGFSNPYSEAYDDAKARELFPGYEFMRAEYPDPFYNIYQFRKPGPGPC